MCHAAMSWEHTLPFTPCPFQNKIQLASATEPTDLSLLMIIRAEKRNSKNLTHLAWVKIPVFQPGTQTEFCSVSALRDISVGTGMTLQITEFAEKQSAN